MNSDFVPQIHVAMCRLACGVFILFGQLYGAPSFCSQPQSSGFSHYKKLEVSDGWFDVYELPGHVYAFYEPKQDQQVLSYLIVGQKRALSRARCVGRGHCIPNAAYSRFGPSRARSGAKN